MKRSTHPETFHSTYNFTTSIICNSKHNMNAMQINTETSNSQLTNSSIRQCKTEGTCTSRRTNNHNKNSSSKGTNYTDIHDTTINIYRYQAVGKQLHVSVGCPKQSPIFGCCSLEYQQTEQGICAMEAMEWGRRFGGRDLVRKCR